MCGARRQTVPESRSLPLFAAAENEPAAPLSCFGALLPHGIRQSRFAAADGVRNKALIYHITLIAAPSSILGNGIQIGIFCAIRRERPRYFTGNMFDLPRTRMVTACSILLVRRVSSSPNIPTQHPPVREEANVHASPMSGESPALSSNVHEGSACSGMHRAKRAQGGQCPLPLLPVTQQNGWSTRPFRVCWGAAKVY